MTPMAQGPQHQFPQQHQYQQQYYDQQYYDPPPSQHYAPSVVAPLPPLKKKKKRSASLFSLETLKKKELWIVAALMLLVIAYGLPKVRATFPSIIDPLTGSTSTPALAALSAMSGLVFVVVDTYVT